MTMSKNLAACLIVLVVMATGISSAKESDIVIKADPQVVLEGITEEITLDCRPLPSLVEEGVVGLVLRICQTNGSEQTPVATATQDGNIVYDAESASATGNIKQGEETYLTVSYKYPSYSEEGVYTCDYTYMDSKYAVHQITASVNVTVEEVIPTTTAMPIMPEVQGDERAEVNVTDCNCDGVWKEINSLKETLLLENQLLKKEVQKYDESCRVSFSARMSSDSPIMQSAKVIFDDVISNKGGAFQASSFVAPCSGQYYFSITLRSNQMMDGGYVDGVIFVDQEEVARTSVFSDFSAMNYQSATNGAVVTLNQGQEVNVKVKTTSRGKLIGSTHSVFSGFYLYP